ncbi:MAG: c-type cytochrome, partial [Chitinophagaceae bacterium]|nr:c-type cytochrome [Chitinophagaceae bacterium]
AGEQIDENSVTLLSGSDLDVGKTVYIANCAPCHGQDCEGIAAPNLTDKYWLHGGSLSDIFISIKYGWVDKGMRAWKDDLKPKEIAQISSYIVSLRNTNAKSSRPQEGVEYTGD